MADDWGCNVDLFGESTPVKSTKSLTELVDCLSKKSMNGVKPNQQSKASAENVQFVPCGNSTAASQKIPMVRAPKILKKKKQGNSTNNNNKFLNETNVKRVTFEVEQLIAREAGKDDRNNARQRILQSLGGAAAKKPYVNYKQLKVELAAKKADQKTKAEMYLPNTLSAPKKKKK